MSFQGADVSSLDRLAQRTQEGADYARKVVIALRIVVAALRAMSWTGFAAAYAAYLQNVVIPWVERTGDALERFANVLRMASALQKSVSEDSPQISIPASAYQSPALPPVSATNSPMLCRPDTSVWAGEMPTGAEGAGAVVIVPVPLGGTASTGAPGADGAPFERTLPIGPATRFTGEVLGGGSSGTSGPLSVPGGRGATNGVGSTGSIGAGAPTHGPLGGGLPGGGAVGSSTGGTAQGSSTGGTTPGSGPVGSGVLGGGALGGGDLGAGSVGGGSAGGSGTGGGAGGLGGGPALTGSPGSTPAGALGGSGTLGPSSGGGPAGGTAGVAGAASGSGGSGAGSSAGEVGGRAASVAAGNPSVHHTPVSSGGAHGTPQAAGAPLQVVDASRGGGINPGLMAAPIGLAGLGTAALGALKAKDGKAVLEGEDDG